ncbi:MAG: SycD/LcrH family type III secretion system chaperone [Verrucomicrobium sp.]|nr:SycD/LcrH family type III secretion system chaperone [Verrucomicrobium sp.]
MTETDNPPRAFALPFDSPDEWAELFENFGKNGRTMQDFTNLSPESMEVFYMVAFNQYNAGHYEESSKIFQLLASLNHFDKRFWMGLGSSRSMEGKHEDAIKAFGYLYFLDMKDPAPTFHCARSLMALGKVPEAEAGLRATIATAEGKPEHADLKAQAETMLELLQQGQKEITAAISQP